MQLWPNSWGATLREFNPCHDPKDGRFAPKGQGDCDPGDVKDPGRNRAVYGQFVPDERALEWHEEEAEKLNGQVGQYGDREEAKDKITKELAKSLVNHEGLDALAQSSYFANAKERYRASGSTPDPNAPDTKAAYERSLNSLPPDPNSDLVAKAYQEYQDAPGPSSEVPNPDDVQDDYDRYKEELQEEAYEKASEAAYEKASEAWDQEVEQATDRAQEQYDRNVELLTAARERFAEPSPYGDVSEHPTLPLDFELKEPTVTLTAKELSDEYLAEHEHDALLSDLKEGKPVDRGDLPGFILDSLDQPYVVVDDFDAGAALEGTEFDPNSDDARSQWISDHQDEYEDLNEFYNPDSFDTWYEGQYGISPEAWGESKEVKSFDNWYEDTYGKLPNADVHADSPPSFEQWYQDRYGLKPSDWTPGDSFKTREALARNIASALIESWAETSSDSSVRSVALQLAANEYFKLGATYAKSMALDQYTFQSAQKYATDHKAVFGAFLQAMYDNTQAWFKTQGYGSDDYVTLLRGWKARNEQEPGLKTVDLDEGEVVDVLLQPISSFSSSRDTAVSFSGYRTDGETPILMTTRVPVKRILGSARTGYGCLNESEFTVLGGRYPSFITARDAQSYRGDFWTKARRKSSSLRKSRQDPVLVRGERL